MCGFGGLVDLVGGGLVAPDGERGHRLCDDLHHRGPDAHRVWTGEGALLAHTRLSIIDLGGSAQPMVDAAGRVMVYNGEIFNYRAVRSRLGGTWSTRGDTEVMMRVLTEGVRGLRELRGQFAAAVWDPATRELTLVRDAMGILPLFWWSDGRRVAFASEPDALRRLVPEPVQVSRDSLALYLAHRAVPAPDTMWQGIHKVQPGHALRFRAGGPPELTDWRPSVPPKDERLDVAGAVAGARTRLSAAVELALEADVPVGAYLSGGLDSSLICAMVRRVRPETELNTYCAVFEDAVQDEGGYAAQVARHLGTTHHEVHVKASDFVDEWPALSRFRGAPVSEPADIALYRLAKAARKDVKVALSGEGADEVFAGYPKYRFAALTSRVDAVPARVRRAMLPAIASILPPRLRRAGVALRALAEPTEADRLRAWFASFTPSEIRLLTGRLPRPPRVPDGPTPLARMLGYDQAVWLTDNLLERGDRMNMAASLELRPPFLDLDLVSFGATIPDRVLLGGGSPKNVLKGVALDLLPEEIVHRRKAGFPVPLSTWLRGDLGDTARELLGASDAFTRPYLDQRQVLELVDLHRSGRADRTAQVWTLLSLEMWGRQVSAGAR